MKRSRLQNIADKRNNPNDIKNYKRQQNYVLNLNKNAKFEYFNRCNSPGFFQAIFTAVIWW